jgi:hypothetical protein
MRWEMKQVAASVERKTMIRCGGGGSVMNHEARCDQGSVPRMRPVY